MIQSLFSMLFSLAVLIGGPPQVVEHQDPVWVRVEGKLVLALHEDQSWSCSMVDDEGQLSVSRADVATPQGQQAQVPVLTTSYVGTDGATHTVTTPVSSTTPAGLAAAGETHKRLVAWMQTTYPPRPVPPP